MGLEKGVDVCWQRGKAQEPSGEPAAPGFSASMEGTETGRVGHVSRGKKNKIPPGSFVNVDFWDLCLHHLILAFFRAGLPRGMEPVWHFHVPLIAI